jgi:hypothetical protein
MDRHEGYYWVNYLGEFRVAYWCDLTEKWYLTDSTYSYDDGDFDHINEVRIKYPGEIPD